MTMNMSALPQDTRVPNPSGIRQSDVAPVTATPDLRPGLHGGDATPWTEVVARYQELMSSRARCHRLSPDEAADVIQQTRTRSSSTPGPRTNQRPFEQPRRSDERNDHDMCTSTLAGGPLHCVRPQGHPGGHEFHSQYASWLDDRHGEGGHG